MVKTSLLEISWYANLMVRKSLANLIPLEKSTSGMKQKCLLFLGVLNLAIEFPKLVQEIIHQVPKCSINGFRTPKMRIVIWCN